MIYSVIIIAILLFITARAVIKLGAATEKIEELKDTNATYARENEKLFNHSNKLLDLNKLQTHRNELIVEFFNKRIDTGIRDEELWKTINHLGQEISDTLDELAGKPHPLEAKHLMESEPIEQEEDFFDGH